MVAAVAAAEGLVTYVQAGRTGPIPVPTDYKANAHRRRAARAIRPISATCRSARAGSEIDPAAASPPGPTTIPTSSARSCARSWAGNAAPGDQAVGGLALPAPQAPAAWRAPRAPTRAALRCGRVSPKRFSRWISRPPRAAAAKCTSPTGLSGTAAAGPGDAGDRDREVDRRVRERALGHRLGGFAGSPRRNCRSVVAGTPSIAILASFE